MKSRDIKDRSSELSAKNEYNAHMAENQVVFRKQNEKIKKSFDELIKVAEEDGQVSLVSYPRTPLHFICECSDEGCRERIAISLRKYIDIHQKRNRFIILNGHEVLEIEKVVMKYAKYCIVEKFNTPPEKVPHLHATSLQNTP